MYREMKKLLTIGIASSLFFLSCEDMFEPAIENILSIEETYDRPLYAQGLLLNAYNRVPTNSFNDVATDDAITNDHASNDLKSATGQWTAMNNPTEQWRNSKSAIQYINNFLSIIDEVSWAKDENIALLFNDRQKGEAYGLRALFMFHLLQAHAGKSATGELLGVPIVITHETLDSDHNHPRNTFEECMQQIYSDLAKAEELLPLDFEDISNSSQIPTKYQSLGLNHEDYNRVFGVDFRLRL